MIKGACDDKGNLLKGEYKPSEFGKITLWQMRNLFGFKGKPSLPDPRELFWNAGRKRGESEFSIYCRWTEIMASRPKRKVKHG